MDGSGAARSSLRVKTTQRESKAATRPDDRSEAGGDAAQSHISNKRAIARGGRGRLRDASGDKKGRTAGIERAGSACGARRGLHAQDAPAARQADLRCSAASSGRFEITWSTMPKSLASSADMKWSRSSVVSMVSYSRPVCFT